MDFFGIGIQEILILAVLVAYVVFIVLMLKNLWRRQAGLLFKIIWALIIIGAPVLGACLYYFWCVAGTSANSQKSGSA